MRVVRWESVRRRAPVERTLGAADRGYAAGVGSYRRVRAVLAEPVELVDEQAADEYGGNPAT